jgi:hypothetical protein
MSAVSSFCLGCGKSIADGERFCGACGRDTQSAPNTPAVDPAVAWGLLPETSGKAIFSLICGIFFIILPFSFVGVIFGYIALSEIRKNPDRLAGKGFAVAGIALSYIGVALTVFLMGLGIYEVRKESKSLNRAHQVTTVPSKKNAILTAVRTLNTAEIAYLQRHPESGYSCSLSDLSSAWQIDSDLHAKETDGYTFELKCPTVKSGSRASKYQLLAYPSADSKKPGAPVYCSDESDVIRISHSGTPEDCMKTGRELSESEITRSSNVYSQNKPQ